MIVGVDYASQEVLLAALLSGDPELIQTYASGDVYLYYGKKIGMIPQSGTKKTHKHERDLQKPVILGWQYWMTGHGLSKNLTAQTGKPYTVDEAQEMLDQLDDTYERFAEFRNETISDYNDLGYCKLKDGWYMWGDNANHRSVGNMPVQGAGADIMRRAVMLCAEHGITVILTLHDALYIECDVDDWHTVDVFIGCMKQAFTDYFKGTAQAKNAELIRVDTYAWGDGLKEEEITTAGGNKVDTMPIYIDERATEEYEIFKPFFLESSGAELL